MSMEDGDFAGYHSYGRRLNDKARRYPLDNRFIRGIAACAGNLLIDFVKTGPPVMMYLMASNKSRKVPKVWMELVVKQ